MEAIGKGSGGRVGRAVQLGPCCICTGYRKVRNVLLLDALCPIPGKGWGCLACNLAQNGAIAVVCDSCLQTYGDPVANLRFACTGFPGTDGRTPIEELEGHWKHDVTQHVGEF